MADRPKSPIAHMMKYVCNVIGYYIILFVLPLQDSVSKTIYIKVNSINEHGVKHLLSVLSKVKGKKRARTLRLIFSRVHVCVCVCIGTIFGLTFNLNFNRCFIMHSKCICEIPPKMLWIPSIRSLCSGKKNLCSLKLVGT